MWRRRTPCPVPTVPTVDNNSLTPPVTSSRGSTDMWKVAIVVALLVLVVHICFYPANVSALTTTPPDGFQPTAHFVRAPVFLQKPQAQLLVGATVAFFAVPTYTVELRLLMPLLFVLAAGHVSWWLKGKHVTCNRYPAQW